MSQRKRVVLLAVVAASIAVTAIVYSRQSHENPANYAPRVQPDSSPTPVKETKTARDPSTPKAICTLTAVQAPDVSGLRLGMALDQTLPAFPGAREDAEVHADLARPPKFGVIRFVIRPEKYESKEKFNGIKKITFSFLDGRMTVMNVGYETHEWKDVDEFIAKFSEGKTLPAIDAWDAQVGMDTQLKTLTCDGFDISAFAGGRGGNVNYIQMRDLAAEKEVNARRAKATQQAEKEVKP